MPKSLKIILSFIMVVVCAYLVRDMCYRREEAKILRDNERLGEKVDFLPFLVESSMMFAYAQDVATKGEIPEFDDKLAGQIVESGEKTYERCWRMPLPEDYKALLKSEFADIHNMSSSRYGGAITAALFLSEFVADVRWAHIDIAGPAYVKKPTDYCNTGGTGFGVRLFCDLMEKI